MPNKDVPKAVLTEQLESDLYRFVVSAKALKQSMGYKSSYIVPNLIDLKARMEALDKTIDSLVEIL